MPPILTLTMFCCQAYIQELGKYRNVARVMNTNPLVQLGDAIAAVLEVPAAPFFAQLGVDLEDVTSAQLHWLCDQLDAPNFRRLILIGHALLQEQVGS